jgi:ribosome-binding protein aMBF1 (putative translation factor)
MIRNDWQLRVTEKRIKDFENALFELERMPESKAQPWLRAAQRESLESELNNLRKQVEEYELLKTGKVALPGPEVIRQVADVLVKTRISKGLNQEELASRLGVSKQCVQQYEQTNYAHVTLSTAHHVMQVLLECQAATLEREPAGLLRSAGKGRPTKSSVKRATAMKKAAPKKRARRA